MKWGGYGWEGGREGGRGYEKNELKRRKGKRREGERVSIAEGGERAMKRGV